MPTGIIIFIVISLFMWFLKSGSVKHPIVNEKGVMILRKNKLFEILGYIFMLIIIALSILLFTKVEITKDTLAPAIGCIALIVFSFMISLSIVIMYKKMKIEVTEEKIKYLGFFSKNNKELSWNDIVKVTYSPAGQELTIYTDNNKLRIQMHTYVGFFDFVNKMTTKIDPSLYKDAIQKLQTAYRKI